MSCTSSLKYIFVKKEEGFLFFTEKKTPKDVIARWAKLFHSFFVRQTPVFVRVGRKGKGMGGRGTSLCARACSQSNRNMEQNYDGNEFHDNEDNPNV